jgi:hypothetical protein
MELPTINLTEIGQLFGIFLVALAVLWGINKAIIIAVSH